MWYRFEEGNPLGALDVVHYQVAWYKHDRCFDEAFYGPDEIAFVIPYTETIEDEDNLIRTKVFVHFGNGDIYELKLEKVKV